MKLTHSLVLTLSLLFVATGHANDAFFSPDGTSVTFVPIFDDGALRRVDLQTKKVEKVALGLPKGQGVVALAPGGDGEVLLLTEKSVWVHDAKGTRKVCDLGEAKDPGHLAVAPSKDAHLADWMFIAGANKESQSRRIFYARKPGEKTFKATFCRRVGGVGASAFTADGRFFFANDGDLWEGGFEKDDDGNGMTVTNGVRIAPLAFLNTDAANGGSMHVDSIMPAGTGIYVALRGHHMGQLVRIAMNPKPAPVEGSGANDALKDHYAYLAKSLASVQLIETDGDTIRNPAAISVKDSERVFFTQGTAPIKMYLWDKATGKTEQVGEDGEK